MNTYKMCAWCQKRSEEGIDPLELASQTVVSCHAGSGN